MATPNLQIVRHAPACSPMLLHSETFDDIAHDLISRRTLQRILGFLWLLDGLLQLFPSMWTTYLIDGIMHPATVGQPGLVVASIQPILHFSAQHIVLVNASIALVQIVLGICLLSHRFVRLALLGSMGWALMVWFGGEGLGMLLTGQASVLTGAPGAVLVYALLSLAAYPSASSNDMHLSRDHLRWFIAGFWALAAALQLQPAWWQSQQISRAIAGNEQPGTVNGVLIDSSLSWLARVTHDQEVLLNSAFIVIALALSLSLLMVTKERTRPLLATSVLLSLLLWWATQGCGQVLTGAATDVNSGPLVILLALACWPTLVPLPGFSGLKRLPGLGHLARRAGALSR